ncbi:tyrosine-type recombinase/integrase [Clostridium sp. CM028]|uniref:tyrosine-type recombinase/integrase n=1 Tax=unclassified Clostridium TaxID=2614128 RepID=UPI001C6EA4A0|nr:MULTISPECIES: tyrosine-type recombinase/integrase [unclassified Clostridium]MBW9147333.1 tyrosine-type recombinase/integrase [Clostridium sp. CM027]MBW9150315.1 tyrosine-type recombinase/integrase [Clostridium sp. CM028]UVE39549.1 tyrosine-type recombinase/integrase [Clostridium sp. CM027]UVE41393.1 tyrosine-type recombinase/integrase [Clostridium sp. CM027]WLC60260.1 tyrosine-type recombinase/integrase [Clostridium sp. CM028]
MEVVKVKTEDGKERYFVADDNGLPIEPILKFIRFKDNTNFARNTLRMYCQHLKLYFEYLQQRELDFQKVTIDDLALFVNWLQNPYKSLKVIPTHQVDEARSPRTVNIIVNAVLSFYDYILRHEEYSNNISDRLKKFVSTPSRNFKGFLYGIAHEQKKVSSNILRLKVPKSKPKTISKDEIGTLVRACNNLRDKFLLILLYETGMRIGEALSLWIEDFDISDMIIDLQDRGELENNAEIKTVSSPRRIDISQNLADTFMEYIAEYHTEEVETNHIFIKLSGENKYKAMHYVDVDNLFRTLKKKTDIYVTPHMFRHTSITTLRMAGWQPELLRIRAGHKNIYTTMNTYIHPSDKEITEEFNKTQPNLRLDIYNEGDE